jgi:hypothetical protein
MPGQECGRCDKTVPEPVPGEQPGERGQDRAVRPGWAGRGDLAA